MGKFACVPDHLGKLFYACRSGCEARTTQCTQPLRVTLVVCRNLLLIPALSLLSKVAALRLSVLRHVDLGNWSSVMLLKNFGTFPIFGPKISSLINAPC